jgi:hypothetical protein
MLARPYIRKRSALLFLAGAALVLVAMGCATIMHGTRQSIGIGSTPTGATVLVDQQPQGTTPVVAKLSRKDHHVLRIEMGGYQPYEATITKKLSGWVWGNIVFGGLIGLAVDAISGGLYKLTPEQIQAELKKEGVGFRIDKDTILLTVTLRPDPSWERIGQMQRDGAR